MDLFGNENQSPAKPNDKLNKAKLQSPLTKEQKARVMYKRKLLKELMEYEKLNPTDLTNYKPK
jgi:hypothetical protein